METEDDDSLGFAIRKLFKVKIEDTDSNAEPSSILSWRKKSNEDLTTRKHTNIGDLYLVKCREINSNLKTNWRSKSSDNFRIENGKHLNKAGPSGRSNALDTPGQKQSENRKINRKFVENRTKSTAFCFHSSENRNRSVGTPSIQRLRFVKKSPIQQILLLEAEDPEKIILSLIENIQLINEIVQEKFSFKDTVRLLAVINKICLSHMDENKNKIIINIIHITLLNTILKNIMLIPSQTDTEKLENEIFWNNPQGFWNNLLVFFQNIYDIVPHTACDILPKIVQGIILTMNNCKEYHSMEEFAVKKNFYNFQEVLILNEKKINQVQNVEQEPPNNFRDINIYPTVREITTREEPYIRPLLTHGSYESTDHYLDIHFRLLKEDFTASLRNGICNYIEKSQEVVEKHQYDVRVYEKVYFVFPVVHRDRIANLLQYTSKIDKKSVEESSKRFIYGSLVCFTSDNFQNIFFGTIVDSDKKLLNKGRITVDIKQGNIEYNKCYTMIESTIFFDPYFQVLTALKKINEDNFSFKNYIVNVSSESKPPKYITSSSQAYFLKEQYPIKVLDCKTWPKPEQVRLNHSQFKAFQTALTHEFCIVQGPPGTGKTYTTIRIVEFLLRNKLTLNYNGPIFVICFTNHALDQFLEEILNYTRYLLRVGGQSKNETVKSYNLQKYRNILYTIVKNAKRPLYDDDYDSDDYDYDPDDKNYDFSDYYHKHYQKNPNAGIYYNLHRDLQTKQELLNDIDSYNGILKFELFQKHLHLFNRVSAREATEWLMENKQKVQLEDEDEKQEENDEINFNLHLDELYSERKIVGEERNFNFQPKDTESNNYIKTPMCYHKKIRDMENTINELDFYDDKQRQMYYNLNIELEIYKNKADYLSWRLKQLKCNREEIIYEKIPNICFDMSPNDRWKFYHYCVQQLQNKINREILVMDKELRQNHDAFQEVKQLRDLYIMRKMHVIGMTTTGAARYGKLLQTLQCPIVIAEEAAETLESHIVVSLSKGCQHLILIGDYQQLRPNTAQYNLAKNYNLEISLFERMVRNGVHCQQLNIQHRMRPEFAKLITPAIYNDLENSPNVEQYLDILGMTKNLYFIDHTNYEDSISQSTTHQNVYEAKYLIQLARYLIKQGYKPDDITILTTYKGQMFCILKERGQYMNELGDVRITVVDNFQGEENKIILLSLVRSNSDCNIGFLNTENRVCVALSRAKEGFYIIGNMSNLEKRNQIWPKIKQSLKEQDAIGKILTTKCQIHSNLTQIRQLNDFEQIPEGGCKTPCNTNLQCGHVCSLLCHPYDREHEYYYCKENCLKTCPRGHPCPKLCSVDCPPCKVLLKTKLPCGHTHSIECHIKPEYFDCPTMVETEFPCGHSGDKLCYVLPEETQCPHPCRKQLICGHQCNRTCHINMDPEHLKYKCEEPCQKYKKNCSTLKHFCEEKCYVECPPCCTTIKKKRKSCGHKIRISCCEDVENLICREKCKKLLSCGHHCRNYCNETCGNCSVMVSKTIDRCGHTIRTACQNVVDISMCNSQCTKKLKCGHPCKNKCNEPCTDYCQVLVKCVDSSTFVLCYNIG